MVAIGLCKPIEGGRLNLSIHYQLKHPFWKAVPAPSDGLMVLAIDIYDVFARNERPYSFSGAPRRLRVRIRRPELTNSHQVKQPPIYVQSSLAIAPGAIRQSPAPLLEVNIGQQPRGLLLGTFRTIAGPNRCLRRVVVDHQFLAETPVLRLETVLVVALNCRPSLEILVWRESVKGYHLLSSETPVRTSIFHPIAIFHNGLRQFRVRRSA